MIRHVQATNKCNKPWLWVESSFLWHELKKKYTNIAFVLVTETWFTRAFIQCTVNKYSVSEKLALAIYVKIFALDGSYTILNFKSTFSFPWLDSPSGPRPLLGWGFEITFRHTTFGRAPLDEWSTGRIDLYLTTHNTYRRRTSMPKARVEPTIAAYNVPIFVQY